MAWIQPKTDWVASDYFNATDYNRIKNNIRYLKNFTDDLFVGLNWVTDKNLLKNTATTQTVNGVTFTVNDDGSITANGTATDIIRNPQIADITLNAGERYILTGSVALQKRIILYYKDDYTKLNAEDKGEGVEFTVPITGVYRCYIWSKAGEVFNNETFYPMLRKAEITDDTYEPYRQSIPDSTADLIAIGADKDMFGLIFAREINNIETNLETINAKTYGLDIGESKTYKPNGKVPNFEDYNRLESATLALYEMAQVHKANLPRLALTLGQKGLRV